MSTILFCYNKEFKDKIHVIFHFQCSRLLDKSCWLWWTWNKQEPKHNIKAVLKSFLMWIWIPSKISNNKCQLIMKILKKLQTAGRWQESLYK